VPRSSKQRPNKPRPAKSDGRNQLRIIGGKWRGRKLDFPIIEGLRPTSDRIRETLFNWLAADVHSATCLDLFAGSGALGFEALSRGANKVVMIEKTADACQLLLAHSERLGAENAKVIHTTAEQWLQQCNEDSLDKQECFDIVFLDPPFQLDWLEQHIDLFASSKIFKPDTLFYLEQGKEQERMPPPSWRTVKHKQTGQVVYGLYQLP